MAEELTIKTEALEPLYEAWEEPNKHRVRKDSGEGAVERVLAARKRGPKPEGGQGV